MRKFVVEVNRAVAAVVVVVVGARRLFGTGRVLSKFVVLSCPCVTSYVDSFVRSTRSHYVVWRALNYQTEFGMVAERGCKKQF